MPEPCELSSQQRFTWAYKEVDLAVHSVVCLLLQEGDTVKFPQTLGFESLDPFLIMSKQGPYPTEEDEGSKILVQLEHVCEADGVASPDPV